MVEEKKNNMIMGFHIIKRDENGLELNTNKMYKWFIPKALRDSGIKQGDIVWVYNSRRSKRNADRRMLVLVMQAYREELEEHEKVHKPVKSIAERAAKKK